MNATHHKGLSNVFEHVSECSLYTCCILIISVLLGAQRDPFLIHIVYCSLWKRAATQVFVQLPTPKTRFQIFGQRFQLCSGKGDSKTGMLLPKAQRSRHSKITRVYSSTHTQMHIIKKGNRLKSRLIMRNEKRFAKVDQVQELVESGELN